MFSIINKYCHLLKPDRYNVKEKGHSAYHHLNTMASDLVVFLVGYVYAQRSVICTLGNEQKRHFSACFQMGLSLAGPEGQHLSGWALGS